MEKKDFTYKIIDNMLDKEVSLSNVKDKPKRGRPKKEKSKIFSKSIHLKLNEEQYNKLYNNYEINIDSYNSFNQYLRQKLIKGL